ncbi:MAG TPA: DUF4340 domain-containing protein [Thermoanaerobaculia bacterium]|nr:DUF4340 domain-containing protein [Thermoanaerobaculia bacterium]
MRRRPLAALASLALALAALVALDRILSRGGEDRRRESVRVEPLLTPEQVEGWTFAVLRVEEAGTGRVFLYGRREGVWLCLSHHGAVADAAAVEGVMTSLLEAEGVVQSEDPERAHHYGLDRPGMLRLSVHGPAAFSAPDADLLVAFDLGLAVPGTGGTYLRPAGSDRVWAVDAPLREWLTPPATDLPPLLDPHLVPAVWPGLRQGLAAVEVRPAGAPAYRRERRVEAPPDGELPPGAPGRDIWVVRSSGRERPAHPFQAALYTAFLTRAPYAGLLPPERAAELGLDPPAARVRLVPAAGEPLELALGAPSPEGVAAASSISGSLLRLDPEVAELLAPPAERLLDAAGGSPWEPFLRPEPPTPPR